jgi:hypothetical protein
MTRLQKTSSNNTGVTSTATKLIAHTYNYLFSLSIHKRRRAIIHLPPPGGQRTHRSTSRHQTVVFLRRLNLSLALRLHEYRRYANQSRPFRFLQLNCQLSKSRGNNDYVVCHDIEDIVVVLDGRPETIGIDHISIFPAARDRLRTI